MFHVKRHDWALWAVLLAACQVVPFLGLALPNGQYSTFYGVISDLSSLFVALFAFSICPWSRIAPKMAAVAFVWWATVCLVGNAAIERLDITMPYEMAALYVIAAALVAFACMRFLAFKTPEIGIVDDDHLYMIVSSPHTLSGIAALIITGMGGAFSIWHPASCSLFKYVRDKKGSAFESVHQSDCPPNKMVIDMGPATQSRIDYLNSQIGAQWSYFNNCLTKIGAVKYDR